MYRLRLLRRMSLESARLMAVVRQQLWWNAHSRVLAHLSFPLWAPVFLYFRVTFKSFPFNQSQTDMWLLELHDTRDVALRISLLWWNLYKFISSNSSRSPRSTILLRNSKLQSLAACDGRWHWVPMTWEIMNAAHIQDAWSLFIYLFIWLNSNMLPSTTSHIVLFLFKFMRLHQNHIIMLCRLFI